MNWWPTATAILAALASVVGLAVPKHVGGWWLALAGLGGVALVLFAAAYRLHRLAFPDFPRHYKRDGFLSYHEDEGLRFFLFDISITNRSSRSVSLEIDLLLQRNVQGQVLDAGALSHLPTRIGSSFLRSSLSRSSPMTLALRISFGRPRERPRHGSRRRSTLAASD
jgi:hypothetical protein